MSLLKNLMKTREQTLRSQSIAETKGERLEIVIDSLIEALPAPAAILARNYMGSFLQFNDENADKVANVLSELKNYISEGSLPNVTESRDLAE